jgi:hypothetical protein
MKNQAHGYNLDPSRKLDVIPAGIIQMLSLSYRSFKVEGIKGWQPWLAISIAINQLKRSVTGWTKRTMYLAWSKNQA